MDKNVFWAPVRFVLSSGFLALKVVKTKCLMAAYAAKESASVMLLRGNAFHVVANCLQRPHLKNMARCWTCMGYLVQARATTLFSTLFLCS